MSENIIDRSYNKETRELQQFTVIDDTGQPQLVKATPENVLLYDPEDELPFDDGMYSFLHGEQALVLQQNDPTVMVAPTNNEYCYIIRVGDRTVETTPNQAERVLRAIKDAAIDRDVDGIVSLHDTIVSTQVRRDVINKLTQTFDQEERITQTNRGWLVDEFYLVNWEASLYTKHNNPEEGDYKRGGGGVRKTDTSYEFVQLSLQRDVTPVEVSVGGSTVQLTEREILFLAKVKWLLNRREHHSDMTFWKFADKYASVDHITGEPEVEVSDEDDEGDEPDLDRFSI
jgi:hypothetical protein